jgi:hypothetical protein
LAEDFDFDGILKFVGELSSESNHWISFNSAFTMILGIKMDP